MPDNQIPNWINELCSIFPCMITASQGQFNVNWGKIVQTLIIVAIMAASTSFVTVKVLESEFDNLTINVNKDITEIKSDIKKIENVQLKYADDIIKINHKIDKWEDEH